MITDTQKLASLLRDGPYLRSGNETIRIMNAASDHIDAMMEHLAAYPADWREDSSLETWFPLTAEQVRAQAAEIDGLRANLEHHQAYWINHRGAALACSSAMRDAYSDEKVRADAAEAVIARLRGWLADIIFEIDEIERNRIVIQQENPMKDLKDIDSVALQMCRSAGLDDDTAAALISRVAGAIDCGKSHAVGLAVTEAEQSAWHAGIEAGREIERDNAAVGQGPVAFLCRECDEEGWSTYAVMPHEVPSTGEFLHVEPLYASPVAAQASGQDREDAERWRHVLKCWENEAPGIVALATQARVGSVSQLIEYVDAARAAPKEKS
ncbi:hypothetical protein [Paracandidimonas soli]|uniref:Uncharacterized protein n=1 Tax=Paracandidimonas soli TaxID=1917182 RepID=A0A4R3VAL5_9BURK|nr:hypothetical protein [Paracandidimonas soli]TCV00539.1 hypothetical protein EV686_103119 [Paracandidimonas soli]